MNALPALTIPLIAYEASLYAHTLTQKLHPNLYGVTDGKAVGTYVEQNFIKTLLTKYSFVEGNAASGLDFPGLEVDIKVTSYRQPQSSCPFRSLRQKVFGLGYGLIVFVYEKSDDQGLQTSRLLIRNAVLIDKTRTADFQMTSGIHRILANHGNQADLVAFMQERSLTTDLADLEDIADDILRTPPSVGYITISPAMQWRLNYTHALNNAGQVPGVDMVYQV